MNDVTRENNTPDPLKPLINLTATVYLCQAMTFMFAGLPLLVGVGLNLFKREAVEGTWLEAHFVWQIKTAWVVLAGFAISGLTFELGVGILTLLATVVWFVYRIAIGWYALNDKKPPHE